MENCTNCEMLLTGEYCSNCGQKKNSGRILFAESIHTVWDSMFSINAPLFTTIGKLIYQPGEVIHSFIKGKRTRIYHPFKLFLGVYAFYYLVRIAVDFNPIESFNQAVGSSPKVGDMQEAGYFLLILAFSLASFAKLFNWKSGLYFGEYLTASFYIISMYLLLSSVNVTLVLFNPKFFLLNYVIVFTYPVFVFYQLHKETSGKVWRILGGFFMNLIAWICYVGLSYSISYLWIIWSKH